MMKYVYILMFMGLLPYATYAQKSGEDKIIVKRVVVEREWKDSHFSSNKTLMENINEMEEVSQILAVFEKGELEALSVSEKNLTIFVPLDIALEKLSRKERKAFLENTSKSELKAMWQEYIVPGRLDEYAIIRNIENQGGKSIFVRTLGKNELEFFLKNKEVHLRDVYGNEAKWVKGDFYHKHGFFHFIDSFLFYEK